MTYCSFLLVHNTYTYFGCLGRLPRELIHSIKSSCLCSSTVLIAPPGWISTVRNTKVLLYKLANFNSQYFACLHVRTWHIVSFSKCCFTNYLVALVLCSFPCYVFLYSSASTFGDCWLSSTILVDCTWRLPKGV